MKFIFIFSCSGMFRDVPGCSGMFRDVPECSGMFRNVPCSGFYRRPLWAGHYNDISTLLVTHSVIFFAI